MLEDLILVSIKVSDINTYKRIGTWSDNANREGVDPLGWFKEAAGQEEQVFTFV